MAGIEFEDLIIQIQQTADGRLEANVLQSPARESFRAPLDIEGLVRLAGAPVAGARAAMGTTEAVPLDAPAAWNADVLGRELFKRLFAGPLEKCLYVSDKVVGARSDGPQRRLRIRLRMDVREPAVAVAAALPWELLAFDDGRPIALTDRVLVRDVPVAAGGAPGLPYFTSPPRVLFVMADPTGTLDLDGERRSLEALIGSRQFGAATQVVRRLSAWVGRAAPLATDSDFLERATFAELQRRLDRNDYDIVHFMGHGQFDQMAHEGQLIFQDGDARRAQDLGVLFAHEKRTRLVTLNACQTATGSGEAGANPFAGVASALVQAGVPAVVAMQFPITDGAAKRFSARFYTELGQGRRIEEAVAAGRKEIWSADRHGHEWATPVLFLNDAGASALPVQVARRSFVWKAVAVVAGVAAIGLMTYFEWDRTTYATVKVRGRVLTAAAVGARGAKVYVDGKTDIEAATADTDGLFSIQVPLQKPAGEKWPDLTLLVRHVGFKDLLGSVPLTDPLESEIQLAPYQLKPVEAQ